MLIYHTRGCFVISNIKHIYRLNQAFPFAMAKPFVEQSAVFHEHTDYWIFIYFIYYITGFCMCAREMVPIDSCLLFNKWLKHSNRECLHWTWLFHIWQDFVWMNGCSFFFFLAIEPCANTSWAKNVSCIILCPFQIIYWRRK